MAQEQDTMKCLRFYDKGDMRIDTIPVLPVRDHEVKLKLAWCGICGSDLHEYVGGANLCPITPHHLTGDTVPVAFGHEFSGRIEQIGKSVTTFKVGDRVTVRPTLYCEECKACEEGLINCCYRNGFIGFSSSNTGGLADYIVIPEDKCYSLPDHVSFEVGALMEPLAVAWHAVKTSPFKDGDSVLICGGGPIGLAVIQCLRALGKCKIIVSEISTQRKEYSKQFGADYVLDPTKEDVVAKCRELCDGVGVNVAFDAAGVKASLDTAILSCKARGTIVNIAVWERPVPIDPNLLVFKEKMYMGIATYTKQDFREVLDAVIDGRIKPEAMITKKIKLDEVIEEGFDALIKDKDRLIKILVELHP